MKRAPLGVLLALACSSAAAEWTPVGGKERIFSAYADKTSIAKTGNSVRMLSLYDFLMADVSADGHPHASTVALREYDCRLKQVRLLAYVDYAGNMGTGRVISPANAKGSDRWDPVVPGALDESFLAVACTGPD